jgi:hypothetical protein
MSRGLRFAPLAKLVATLALMHSIAGCGGGMDGTGAPASPPPTLTPVTSRGVMTKGSVILNGTRFDDSRATIIDDRGRSAAQLANGMVVRLRGRADEVTSGVADLVDIENEVRGRIQTLDAAATPKLLTVSGLTVSVSTSTVYAGVADFAALMVGMRVEVHGLRDAEGVLRASRIEAVAVQDGEDELRGPVTDIDVAKDEFTINGNVLVRYTGAAFRPAGAAEADLKAGGIVEVRGTLAGAVFTAAQVDIEELEDRAFQSKQGDREDVEGVVSGFSAHPGTFNVGARTVQTTAATTFEEGTAAQLKNGAFVEVEGTVNSEGVLVAKKIELEESEDDDK